MTQCFSTCQEVEDFTLSVKLRREKQPTKAVHMPTVPEFSHIIVICNLPCEIDLPITGSELRTCTLFSSSTTRAFCAMRQQVA